MKSLICFMSPSGTSNNEKVVNDEKAFSDYKDYFDIVVILNDDLTKDRETIIRIYK